MIGSSATAHDNGNILAAIMGTSGNTNNPLLFANTLLHQNDNNNPLNILVQNWEQNGANLGEKPQIGMTESLMKVHKNEPDVGVIKLF